MDNNASDGYLYVICLKLNARSATGQLTLTLTYSAPAPPSEESATLYQNRVSEYVNAADGPVNKHLQTPVEGGSSTNTDLSSRRSPGSSERQQELKAYVDAKAQTLELNNTN
jgi:hypothetical protein